MHERRTRSTCPLVLLGEVPSHAGDGTVFVLGRAETVAAALGSVDREDAHELPAHQTVPRFDLDWLPDRVLAIGDLHESVHDGPFLEFDRSRVDALLEALTAAGFRVERDDDTLRRAEGYASAVDVRHG